MTEDHTLQTSMLWVRKQSASVSVLVQVNVACYPTAHKRSSDWSIGSVMSTAIDTVNITLSSELQLVLLYSFFSYSPHSLTAVPSRPPGNVTAQAIGNNQVRVTWTPPANVSGYQVLTTTNTSSDVNSVNIEDPNAVEHILGNLSVGVRYSISVIAYANLPSEQSAPVNVVLRCKFCIIILLCE